MAALEVIYRRTPAWLRPTLTVLLLLLGAIVTVAVVRLIFGRLLDVDLLKGALVPGGSAIVIGAVTFGLLREFALRSDVLKIWAGWLISCLVGALAFLPIANVTLRRGPFAFVPPQDWLLVWLGCFLVVGAGFAYAEAKMRRDEKRSSNNALERTREG